MAERSSREGQTRRQSFRQTLVEAALPPEYLDALEHKRRQLDESIHKYIAAKERDYKQYEKEVRQQLSLSRDREKEVVKTRRTSSESTQEPTDSPRLLGKQQSAREVLSAAGLTREHTEHVGQPLAVAIVDDDGSPRIEAKPLAGLTDRRASMERGEALIGVFTPAFLPALEDQSQPRSSKNAERPCPAFPGVGSPSAGEAGSEHVMQRANSDSLADLMHKRPANLQLLQRNSSSGSSVDGKLTSAMRSPTHPSRPNRKRVSIAVGDSIVAPSDNVPVLMSNRNSTPPHSRTLSRSIPEQEANPAQLTESSTEAQRQPVASTPSSQPVDLPPNVTPIIEKTSGSTPADVPPFARTIATETKAVSPIIPTVPFPSRPAPKMDPDGDLFDLDDEDDDANSAAPDSLDMEDTITGRVDRDAAQADDNKIDDMNTGSMPESDSIDVHADHIEFGPGSAVASQQPTNPGFRRPSVTFDPVYIGSDIVKAEENAIVNDVYGSSYTRPGKGSFTSGSLGESFMARNADQMMRNRATQESTQVRS